MPRPPAEVAVRGEPTPARFLLADRGLLLVIGFCLALLLIPATVVLAGPLRSNGSPAVLLSLGLGVLVVVGLAVGEQGLSLRSSGVLILLTSGAMMGTVWAHGQLTPLSPDAQAGATRFVLRVLSYTAVSLSVMWVARCARARFAIVVALVVGLSYCAVIGILQSRAGIDGRFWLQPPGFVLNREFSPTARAGYTRALGTSDSAIEFAVLMSCLLALSVLVVRAAQSTWTVVIGVVGLALGPVALLDSLSRTAVVTAAGVAVAFLISLRLRSMLVMLVALCGGVAVLYVLDPSRFAEIVSLVVNAGSDSSVTSRTDDYAYVGQSFRSHPLLGLGPGTQSPESTRYIDNHWLQAILVGGVVAVAGYAAMFVGGVASTVGPYRSPGHKRECVAYLAVMVAVIVASFTFDLFAFAQARTMFFIAFGLACASRADVECHPGDPAVRSHDWRHPPRGALPNEVRHLR